MTIKELSEKTGLPTLFLQKKIKAGELIGEKQASKKGPPHWVFDQSALAVCEGFKKEFKPKKGGGMVITGQDFISGQEIPLVKD